MGDFHPKVKVNGAVDLLDRKSIHADSGLMKVCQHRGCACDFYRLNQMKLPFLCVRKC